MRHSVVKLAEHLRTVTRDGHHSLDHHPLLMPLVRPDLSRGNYAQALAALHAPQQALESLLAGFAPIDSFPARIADMEADLAELTTRPAPLHARLMLDMNESAALGVMYVIEGANLGGSVIASQLDANLPQRFFSGAGGTTRWNRFWTFVNDCHPDGNHEEITAAARHVFAFYKAHLDGVQQSTN